MRLKFAKTFMQKFVELSFWKIMFSVFLICERRMIVRNENSKFLELKIFIELTKNHSKVLIAKVEKRVGLREK